MCEFYAYFQPELHQKGFEGIFSAKSRARTMRDRDRQNVDGCAIFFRCSVRVFFIFIFILNKQANDTDTMLLVIRT